MNMLDTIKLALRIETDALDSELMLYIRACEFDLKRVGIQIINERDAVIRMLVQLYCKGYLNWHGAGEQYKQAYEFMRDGISLSGEYNGEELCTISEWS